MAVSRMDSRQELQALQHRMNKLLETSAAQSSSATNGPNRNDEITGGAFTPHVDIYYAEDRIIIRADLPGVRAEEIEVQIENQSLTFSGERKMEPGLKVEDFLRVERPFGFFKRTFALPDNADPASARAEVKDGTLEITISMRSASQPRAFRVEVR